jgi:DNA polymerase III subunit delta'
MTLPMNVLVGHERALAQLARSAGVERPAHAYLFTGTEGIGKKKAAVKFACMLNCPHPSTDPDESCSVCRRIHAEAHPDVMIERPLRGAIRIDRIRYLQNFFRYPPTETTWRILIIDDAHSLNRSAQNALLKILEEPPPGRLIILVTSRPYLLLSTVRSRCRHIGFAPISQETLAEFLQREHGVSLEKSWILAGMGCGSISQALEMDTPGFLRLRETMISALSDPGARGISGLLELSAEISSDRKSISDAILVAFSWIRDLLHCTMADDGSTVINRDFVESLPEISSRFTRAQLFGVYDELLKGSQLIDAEINVNRNLAMDVMFLKIGRIFLGTDFGISTADALRTRHE